MSEGSSRVLVVTNDFPPRAGGIQTFVHEVLIRQPASSVVVYTSDYAGAAAFDAQLPFPVVRDRSTMLLPTPRVARRAVALAGEHGCDAVWFGAAAPLGLLAPALRAAGARRIVATTHGHEVGWAMIPGARRLLARIASGCDVVTYLGDYTRTRLTPVMAGRTSLQRFAPGVDPAVFAPDPALRAACRQRYGLGERPVIVCVSRLVPRKGQDTLIRALPQVRQRIPDAALLLVGGGTYERSLRASARRSGVAEHVVFTGRVPVGELPAYFLAGDVFAMPCRTRRAGLDVEGLGIVYLEASASGLSVVAGDSGGAPDAVLPGRTGEVVDGRDVGAVAQALITMLSDPTASQLMGRAGRQWVLDEWTWDRVATRWRELLATG